MSAHAWSWGRRAASVAAAVLAMASLVGADWAAGLPRAAAQGPAGLAGVARGPDTLGLLGQSPWVGPGESQFKMDLAVSARDPGSLDLVVVVYQELITRSEFQAVLAGSFPAPYYQSAPLPLRDLARGPFGGAEVDVPVNSPSGGLTIGSTGVYPVQVLLERQGLTQGKPLTTFLVYAAAGDTSFKHLDVAVVVPLLARVPVSASGSLGPVLAGQADAVEADVAAVFDQRAPVTLEAPAWVLEAMSKGPAAARRAVFELARSAAAGDEVLPSTWLPVNIGSFVASGLSGYLSEQLSTGASVQSSLLGVPPSTGTWAVFERATPTSLGALYREGVR